MVEEYGEETNNDVLLLDKVIAFIIETHLKAMLTSMTEAYKG